MSEVQREAGSPDCSGASALRGGRPRPWAAHGSFLPSPQLDADDAKPNLDEEHGRDEYDEVHMPV